MLLFVFCRYSISIVLAIVAGVLAIPAIIAFVRHKQVPEDRVQHVRFKRWLWITLAPLILLACLYIFDIKEPHIEVFKVEISEDGIGESDGAIIVEPYFSAYDLRNTEVQVTAIVDRDYTQGAKEYVAVSDTVFVPRDKSMHMSHIRIPFKALKHKKGTNAYSICIKTFYRDKGQWRYLYNRDGFHAYTRDFKTSNLSKQGSTAAKPAAKPAAKQVSTAAAAPIAKQEAPRAAQTASKQGSQSVPNSLMGITIGDSKATVRSLLAQKNIAFEEEKDEPTGMTYFYSKNYRPKLLNRTFDQMAVYFKGNNVRAVVLWIEEATPEDLWEMMYTHSWEDEYEVLQEKLMEQYGRHYSAAISKEHAQGLNKDGQCCVFINEDLGCAWVLQGESNTEDPDILGEVALIVRPFD